MLRACQLTKTFGGLSVLQEATIDFHPGEVHALAKMGPGNRR